MFAQFLTITYKSELVASRGDKCGEPLWWGSSGQELMGMSQMAELACPSACASEQIQVAISACAPDSKKIRDLFFTLISCQFSSQCPIAIIIKSEASQDGYLHTARRITKNKTA